VIAPIVVFTLVNGAVYALLASGMTLIFGAARLVNLVHTAFAMLAAYGMFFLVRESGLGIAESGLITLIAIVLLSLLVYQGLLNRVRQHPQAILLITLALGMVFQEVMLLRFTGTPKHMLPFVEGFTTILGVNVRNQYLLVVGGAVAVIIMIMLILRKTKLGITIRAVADDPETANLMGISVPRTLLITMGLGTALAAVAGILMSPVWTLTPFMWLSPLTMILVIVVLGGLGSIKGSLAGAFIIALVENLVVFLLPRYAFLNTTFALAIMAIVLVVRPGGLFGIMFEEEKL